MYQKRQLTVIDYVALSGAIVGTLFTLVKTLLTARFRGRNGAPTYLEHVVFSALRKFTSLSAKRGLITALAPTTSEVYSAYMRKKGLEPHIVNFHDTLGCWMGDSNADVVLVWFHGGAYAFMATPTMMDLLWDILMKAKSANKSLSIFLPQYDMAPQVSFPQPLIQGTAAIENILNELQRPSSQVILGGDSAGANLALGVLSHIMHPNASIPVELTMNGLFRGIALVSPWVTFDQTSAAFENNKSKDVLSKPALKVFSEYFMADASRSEYNHPLYADPAWWKNMPADSILLLAGRDEIFIDDISAFGDKLKVHNGTKIEELFAEQECHDRPLMEYMMGFAPGPQTRRLIDWVVERT